MQGVYGAGDRGADIEAGIATLGGNEGGTGFCHLGLLRLQVADAVSTVSARLELGDTGSAVGQALLCRGHLVGGSSSFGLQGLQ